MPEDKGRTTSPRAEKEEKILTFWKENNIFQKSLQKNPPAGGYKGDFIFYEGPPTANGKPGFHHLEARAFKDAIPRYKTMQGFHVPRKAGWDTHGLPVELEVEKNLGFKSKKEIETYGIAAFNKKCRESVGMYIEEWQKFTDRIGYWIDLNDAYFTYNNSYISTVWSVIAKVEERNLLYKDYKVVPWCPRCGTGLSSHELGQPGAYEDIKDLSVTVKFKISDFPNAYFLAWTTTPWTLPGNVALAVGKDIVYVEIKLNPPAGGGEEVLVLAKERLVQITEPYEILTEHKGSEMVGMSYEPLYPYIKNIYTGEGMENAYKVYVGDFVTTEDGTGIVHTAVMYGQEDFELGSKVGLPKQHLVDEAGHFISDTAFLSGRYVREIDQNGKPTLAVDIVNDLKSRNLFFSQENYKHSYPHCWRCKTPLIYYARDSWYIRMSALRDDLVRENELINWEPAHIKSGRFGEWLKDVKDWAISRERYWGTPMPIWINNDGSKRIVVDSIETLKKYVKKSGNTYFTMRHGRSQNNELNILSGNVDNPHHLTEDGKEAVIRNAKNFKEKVDLIFASPFIRTRETAELVREELGLPKEALIIDVRLSEMNFGDFDGKTIDEYHALYPNTKESFDKHPSGGENEEEVKRRVGEFLYEIEAKYSGKNILIVSHGDPIWTAHTVAEAKKMPSAIVWIEEGHYPKYAEINKLDFVPLPHNENYELDLHKPYIDEVVLVNPPDGGGEEYTRVKEVMDIWLDSGSMPIAQSAGSLTSTIAYPADFISEAIDQTRGWFYTLHAVGILTERGRAFKNAICLGHIMDKDGKKMSKSVGNVLNPWEMMDKYGVDTLRLWMYGVNQPGDAKNFDERSVEEVQKKLFNLIENVHSFYDLYRDKSLEVGSLKLEGNSVLDKWILTRLEELISLSTYNLDNYKLLEPVRAMREFVDDLSTWYLRRSRDRIKDGDTDAKQTLYYVLKEFSKILAPFAPFASEDMYQKLRNETDPESVHLCDWPKVRAHSLLSRLTHEYMGSDATLKGTSSSILTNMARTRDLVSKALEARSKAGIKIRQPLQKLEVKSLKLDKEYMQLIKEELNVKEILENENLVNDVLLDTHITPELEEEGKLRDVIRALQDMRKERGLKPSDVMDFTPETDPEFYKKHQKTIESSTNIKLV